MRFPPIWRLASALALVASLLGLVPACEGLDGPERWFSAPAPVASAPAPAQSALGTVAGRLRLYGTNPADLDPARAQDVATWQYLLQIYSGLVKLNERLEVVPDAAESWQITNGGRTYRFHLRPGLKFQDAKPVTANDFKYSLERATDPASHSPVAGAYLGDIAGAAEKLSGRTTELRGVRVVDERTLEITIDAPKTYFLSKLTYPTAFVVDRANVEGGGSQWWRKPNGTGPFRLKEWIDDDHLLLERNENYYGPLPTLDQIDYYLGGGSPMTMYERDELDVVEVGLGDIERVLDPTNPLSKELLVQPLLSLWYIGFNTRQPPFDDIKVRQAFNLATDKDKLVNITFKRTRAKAEGVLPPGMPGYQSGFQGLGFNPAKARQLIAESKYGGVENLPEITLTLGEGGGPLGQTLAEMYHRNLGVKINVMTVGEGFFADLEARRYQMYYMGWVADYADPQDFLDVLLHSQSPANYGNYSNPEVDSLLERARTESDNSARLRLYAEAERKVVEDAALVPLFHDVSHVLVKPRVRGLRWTPLGILSFAGTSVAADQAHGS